MKFVVYHPEEFDSPYAAVMLGVYIVAVQILGSAANAASSLT